MSIEKLIEDLGTELKGELERGVKALHDKVDHLAGRVTTLEEKTMPLDVTKLGAAVDNAISALQALKGEVGSTTNPADQAAVDAAADKLAQATAAATAPASTGTTTQTST